MKKVSTIDEIVKSTEVVYHVSIVESHVKFSKMLFLAVTKRIYFQQ